jgi:hypothetical protein
MTANTYEIVPGSKCEASGQAKLVWEILQTGPHKVADIVPKLDANPNFKTRQTTLRIAAYYVCVFHKAGAIRPVDAKVEAGVPEMQHD